MNNPTDIFVHCTATREGHHYTAADIDRWHRDRGWCCIGYHRVVLLDGSIEVGRDPDRDGDSEEHVGAHVYGHNRNSLAVVYVGGVAADGRTPKDTRTQDQREALLEVVRGWMTAYDIPVERVWGHYEKDSGKACPSFDMREFRDELKAAAPVEQFPFAETLPVIGGQDTARDIRALQRQLGVTVDGFIGPETYRALGRVL